MEEKICVALGAIGSPEAINDLSEIAESRSFLRIRAYPEKVKAAAARALASIRKKQAEADAEVRHLTLTDYYTTIK
jgi:HEAT repeat protein